MMEYNKEKKFIDLPEYPGGKKAFQEFIRKNLKYPTEALKHKIEGTVHVKYRVDGLGKIVFAEVIRGIGYGCDEEALRLIKTLKYGRAKNRGVRVTTTKRTIIKFAIPKKTGVQYNYVKSAKKKSTKKENTKSGESYGYTISF